MTLRADVSVVSAQQAVALLPEAALAWNKTFARLGLRGSSVDEAFDRLVELYLQPDRHYHNLGHVLDVLRTLNDPKYELSGDDLVVAELAAWFHDAIYSSRSQDNESKSAALAQEILAGLGVDSRLVQRVTGLIMDTAAHQPHSADPASPAFLDADLMILASAPEVYRKYAAAIRQEYWWVEDGKYRQDRGGFLVELGEREPFFLHPANTVLEPAAMSNINAEIVQLGRNVEHQREADLP